MSAAFARFSVNYLSKPISGAVIDGFGDVEPKVEPRVICSTKNGHNFMLLMFYFAYSELGILLFEVVRVYEGSLVPEKLFAGTVVLGKQPSYLFLDDVSVIIANCVPKF